MDTSHLAENSDWRQSDMDFVDLAVRVALEVMQHEGPSDELEDS
jgi:hypothetical protein